ncbi:MAG: zinc-dependent metalloprotease [Acidimicrobiales bacterium]
MSGFGPFGAGDPFDGVPFFADLAKMLSQQGPVSWDAARQLAHSIALGGESEPNVDPAERIELEQLARVADLHVGSTTGLATSVSGTGASIVPVTRAQWLTRALDAYKPLFEAIASALTPAEGHTDQPEPADPEAFEQDPEAAMGAWLGGMMQMLSPMMLGMTAGSMVGHLATRSLGQYDLPIPRQPGQDEIMVVVRNLDELGSEWSLDRSELRLWLCLHEIAHHAVLTVPHVRARLVDLLERFASSFDPDSSALEERLGTFDPSDPQGLSAMQSMFAEPEVLVGAIRSPAQEAILPQLEALVAAIVGYVDWVMDTVGGRIMSGYGQITEAMRRRRVESAASDRFVGQLLGLDLTQALYDRGSSFVGGVVERAGPEGLDRLWQSERELPTPAEIDAPGLWLARIDLPDDDG